MSGYPLQVNNLGRTVGQIRYLNPPLYPTVNTFSYTDSIGSLATGRTDGYTQLKPSSGIGIIGGSANISNLVASETLVAAAGDIWVDTATGRWRSFTPLTAADKISYTVDTSEWAAGFEYLPSVIPDPRQTTFTSCRISKTGSSFFINLPPRQPLNISAPEKPERYPSSTDYTSNQATSTSLPRKLWQSSGVNALADDHYRYSLSKEIRDVWSGLSVGAVLPEGLLYIYDQSAKTILEDVVFTKTANIWVYGISSATVDFNSKVTSTESQADYNSAGYSIITTGTSIARAIGTLYKAAYGAGNQSNGNFSPVIDHSSLRGLNPASGVANYPTSGFVTWTPSKWGHGDDHTQYLSRAGSWGTTANQQRDPNDNAMLGDLVMAADTISGGNYLNFNGDSRKIYFWKRDSLAPRIYSEASGLININGGALQISKLGTAADPVPSIGSDFTFGFNVQTVRYYKYSVFINGIETVNTNYWSADTGPSPIFATLNLSFNVSALSWTDKVRIYVSTSPNFTSSTFFDFGSDCGTANILLNTNGYTATGTNTTTAITTGTATPVNSPVLTAETYPSVINLSNLQTTRSKLYNTAGINSNSINATSFTLDSSENYPTLRLIPNGISTVSGDLSAGSIYSKGGTQSPISPVNSNNPAGIGLGATYISDGSYWNKIVTRTFPTALMEYGTEALPGGSGGVLGVGATERVFGACTHTVPANTITIGSGFRVRFVIQVTTHNASDTLTVRIRYGSGVGGTTLFSSGANNLAVNNLYVFDVWFQWSNLTTGPSSGSGWGGGFASIVSATSNTLASSTDTTRALATSFSGTDFAYDSDKRLVITGQWSSSGANSATLQSLVIEKF